jgi:hypothetical protein
VANARFELRIREAKMIPSEPIDPRVVFLIHGGILRALALIESGLTKDGADVPREIIRSAPPGLVPAPAASMRP